MASTSYEEEYVSSDTVTESTSITRRGRGIAKGDKVQSLDPGIKLPIEFNEYGQACGVYTPQLNTWIGIQARSPNIIPLNYPNWKKVPQPHKDDAWARIKEKFELDESSKKFILHKLNARWKDFKHELKKDVFDKYDSDVDRRHNLNKRVPDQQWDYLLSKWEKEEHGALCARNSRIRSKQTMQHCTGKTPFAVIREKKRLELGKNPSRFDMFKETHTKKDGTASDPVSAEKIVDMDRSINDKPEELHNDFSVKESIFSDVVGQDSHGRVRMVTFGITPKNLHGTATQRAEKLTIENVALRGEMVSLKDEVMQLRNENSEHKEKFSTIDEKWAAMESRLSLLTQLLEERQT